jgi:hypothetical protein
MRLRRSGAADADSNINLQGGGSRTASLLFPLMLGNMTK